MKVLWGLHPVKFFLGASAVAWAIGFAKYLGAENITFPVFPNILDVIGLCILGSYLFYDSYQHRKK